MASREEEIGRLTFLKLSKSVVQKIRALQDKSLSRVEMTWISYCVFGFKSYRAGRQSEAGVKETFLTVIKDSMDSGTLGHGTMFSLAEEFWREVEGAIPAD
jgi:hypothetical protein